jgi:hypothetical protein
VTQSRIIPEFMSSCHESPNCKRKLSPAVEKRLPPISTRSVQDEFSTTELWYDQIVCGVIVPKLPDAWHPLFVAISHIAPTWEFH